MSTPIKRTINQKDSQSSFFQTHKIHIYGALLLLTIAIIFVGGYYLYQFLTTEITKIDIVASKDPIILPEVIPEDTSSNLKRLISFNVRGTSGEEKFKLMVDDEVVLSETLLDKTYKTYIVEIPYASKTITFTFTNDGIASSGYGRDIIIGSFYSDHKSIMQYIRDRAGFDQPRIDKYKSGILMWGGDYIIDLPQ